MDALQELQEIEGVDADARITALQEAWAAVVAQVEAGTLEADEQRALVLVRSREGNLTTRKIAQAIRSNQSYVVFLLRYHRFLITTVIKIPESRFRAYWAQHSDPHFRTRDPLKLREYEESIFTYIEKQINAGEVPQKPSRLVKSVTNADIHKKADPMKAYAKEVKKRVKEEFEPVIKDLIALSKADRSTFAPSIMGGLGSKLQHLLDNTLSLLVPPRD